MIWCGAPQYQRQCHCRRGARRRACSKENGTQRGTIQTVRSKTVFDGAAGRGRRPCASVAASLCYNFFFLPSIYTFTITEPTNVAAFFFFMLIAILVSNFAARVRTQAVTAIGRLRTTESLYAFSRKLAGTATLDDVLWATAYQTALMLKVRVVLLLPEDGVLTVSGYPPEDELDRADLAAANWTWSNDRPAERGSDTLPGAKRLFLPTGRGLIGVIGTIVDCVERPDLAAGTEELSNALQTVRALDDQARRVDDSSREPVARWYPRLLAGEPSRTPLRRRRDAEGFETVGTVVAERGARHDVPGRRGSSGMERSAA